MLVSPLVLEVFGLFSPELYFVVSFVWFLSVTEVFAPQSPAEDWWRWVQWVKVGGFVVLAYVVADNVGSVI